MIHFYSGTACKLDGCSVHLGVCKQSSNKYAEQIIRKGWRKEFLENACWWKNACKRVLLSYYQVAQNRDWSLCGQQGQQRPPIHHLELRLRCKDWTSKDSTSTCIFCIIHGISTALTRCPITHHTSHLRMCDPTRLLWSALCSTVHL
jgi:hypothetical protein